MAPNDKARKLLTRAMASARVKAALLALLTVVAYLPVLKAGFIWDDDEYVSVKNRTLRDVSGLVKIWIPPSLLPQYYPLVHTSFWLEYQMWRFQPTGYHITNVLLHSAAAILFALVLTKLRMPGAWIAAFLFAVHPIEVESVAWVTERKNVLSCLLYLASGLGYLVFWERSDSLQSRSSLWRSYGLASGLFILALFSKTVTCSLPAALLLIRWWRCGRLTRRDVLPLLPWFVAGLLMARITSSIETHEVGAQGPEWKISFSEHLLVAGRIVWFYAGKLIWPSDLTFIYPRWEISVTVWWQWLFPLLALVVVAAFWIWRKKLGRGPLVALLFYGGTLVPALGFANVYAMLFSFVADHFQYLAGLGLFALVASGLCRLPRLVSVGLAIVLAALTWQQTHIYESVETLWKDTLAKNPGCWLAHCNLGFEYKENGRWSEAESHLRKALELRPTYPLAMNNLGATLYGRGDFQGAIKCFESALRQLPGYADAHNNLGLALARIGDTNGAQRQYQMAIDLQPALPRPHNNLANLLMREDRVDEAVAEYRKALDLDPDFMESLVNLGWVSAGRGDLPAAIICYEHALELRPDDAASHADFARVLAGAGHREAALAHAREALRLNPGDTETKQLLQSLDARPMK